jgi:hypothetical protein
MSPLTRIVLCGHRRLIAAAPVLRASASLAFVLRTTTTTTT